ncbi:MAG: heavy metal translocating P-type ATPase [Bdellovibrionota bacterium]|nr:heavy metal translocating P-type ATPase [Bdellovibrionota bacterium]
MDKLAQIENNGITELKYCKHCGTVCPDSRREFCCIGCENVFQFINGLGLNEYYRLKTNDGEKANNLATGFEKYDFHELKSEYTQDLGQSFQLNLYVEGIHCAACLWILERIPQILNGVLSAKLNMGKSLLQMEIEKDQKISEILNLISKFGYKAQPLKSIEDLKNKIDKEKRDAITKIGITAAITGNIMLMSTSIYGGATGKEAVLFNHISAGLMLVILFYSATEFYKNAIQSIRNFRFSIDISLSLAILFGTFTSYWHYLSGNSAIYFDSIAGFVFLILSSRYLIKYVQWESLKKPKKESPYFPELSERILKAGKTEECLSKNLSIGDHYWSHKNSYVSCDSKLVSTSAMMDESMVTGEFQPVLKQNGDTILAGSKNLSKSIILEVNKTQEFSEIYKLFSETDRLQKNHFNSEAEKYAKYLSLMSYLFAFAGFFYWEQNSGLQAAMEVALAVLIISCPCAFAIATPLSIRRASDLLKAWGIFIKNPMALDKLNQVQNIFLDKTGTLTHRDIEIDELQILDKSFSKNDILFLLYQLEKYSAHPFALAIRNFCLNEDSYLEEDESLLPKEILGKQVSMNYKGNEYIITGSDSSAEFQHTLVLTKNGKEIAKLHANSFLKKSIPKFIKELQRKAYHLVLLSGDKKSSVEKIAEILNIKNYFAEVKPEDKASIVKKSNNSLMIGDGANDAMALKVADIGIATTNSIDFANQSADICLEEAKLEKIVDLLALAKALRNNILSNYMLSLAANVVFIYLALSGLLSPLQAAFIMPIQSFVLSGKSVFMLRESRFKNQEQLWKS